MSMRDREDLIDIDIPSVQKAMVKVIVASSVMAAIVTLISFFAIKNHNANELNPERYAVNISDEVSMNEFVGNYTIVEQKGNVYIIEVKGEQK